MLGLWDVILTISGMNYNPKIEGTPVRDFLLGLKRINPLLVRTFEAGRHMPLFRILRLREIGL